MTVINPAFARLGDKNAFAVLAKAAELQRQGRDIINLGIGQPDFKTPPTSSRRRSRRCATANTAIPPRPGSRRARPCGRPHRRLGVDVSPTSS